MRHSPRFPLLMLLVVLAADMASRVAAAELEVPFTLTRPAGNGPFPAVVILHDCSGLGPRSSAAPWRWATRLTASGYVTIWPDSFSTRGHPDGVCTIPGTAPTVGYRQRARDAYAALGHLRSLLYVDASRIAVIGGSHGGSSTLAVIVDTAANAPHRDAGFAAAIALYPGCANPFGDWSVVRDKAPGSPITGYQGIFKPLSPLLILSGELDDWTPAEPCRQLATRAKAAGHPVDITVYPGAHHSFDNRNPVVFNPERRNQSVPGGRGATTGGNPQAWAAAIVEVERFLAQHLAPGGRKSAPVAQ